MNKNLPQYELKIDEFSDAMVEAIALVSSPAIESTFLAFSAVEPKGYKFSLDEEKMELLGAAMIPNMNIYRRDDNGFEYEVFFSQDTIRKISQLFLKRGFQSNLNIEHQDTSADSYIFQSMLVDKEKGITPLGLPDGSWVIGVKVQNKDLWSEIKAGKKKGFSVEGIFELVKSSFKSEEYEQEAFLKMLQQMNTALEKKINKNRNVNN